MCLQLLTGTVIKNQFLICGLFLGNILSRVDFFFFFSCLGSPHREMPTHASILAWRISWAEETGGLQSMGSHRVRHTHSPPVHLWRITCGRRHSFTHLSSTQELYAERSYRAGRDPLQACLILQVPNKPCGVRGLVRCVTERSRGWKGFLGGDKPEGQG